MNQPGLIQNFSGGRALVLAARNMLDSLEPTLAKLGVSVEYPPLVDGGATFNPGDLVLDRDILFVDGDLALSFDLPLRSKTGLPPVPLIGLVGVEAPSRLKALMMLGATAFLRKPVHGGAVYSALFLGVNEFLRRQHGEERIAEYERRRGGRRFVIKATVHLMRIEGIDDEEAYNRLRRESMKMRMTLEDFCEALVRGLPQPRNPVCPNANYGNKQAGTERKTT